MANGTVPILFSSIVADGMKDMIEKTQFKSPLTAKVPVNILQTNHNKKLIG
jgi:hypothetical protein